MSEQPSKPTDRFSIFLVIACAALAALTLLLALQNRSLKAQLATALSAPAGGLKAGDTIAPFDVVNAAGDTTHVTFDGQGETLLLVFSSTCGACHETLPVWNRLLAGGVSSSVKIVGIQTDFQHADSSSSAGSIPDLRFPVFGAADPTGELMTKFPAIPAAAVLDATGKVKSVWFGVPSESQVSELRGAIAG